MLQDIAILTGAQVITEEAGIHLKDATAEVLGSAEKISINKDTTTIVNGAGQKEAIEGRVQQLASQAEKTESSYDKEKLEERKAKLQGGVAVIRVGAATEAEMKQQKQVFEDSLNSTKAAISEGIVTGGGVALFKASEAIAKLKLSGDQATGSLIVQAACGVPLKQIAENAGRDGSVILSEVKEKGKTFGYNAKADAVSDLWKDGVLDAVKIIRTSLTNAISVAGIILISEALIGEAEDEEETA
jgi:chaperonin GroEL